MLLETRFAARFVFAALVGLRNSKAVSPHASRADATYFSGPKSRQKGAYGEAARLRRVPCDARPGQDAPNSLRSLGLPALRHATRLVPPGPALLGCFNAAGSPGKAAGRTREILRPAPGALRLPGLRDRLTKVGRRSPPKRAGETAVGCWFLGFDLRILSPLWRRDAALILERVARVRPQAAPGKSFDRPRVRFAYPGYGIA